MMIRYTHIKCVYVTVLIDKDEKLHLESVILENLHTVLVVLALVYLLVQLANKMGEVLIACLAFAVVLRQKAVHPEKLKAVQWTENGSHLVMMTASECSYAVIKSPL